MIGKNRGMGQDCMSYAELTSNLEQCNQTDVSSQFACAQSNMNAQQAISNLQIAYQDCVPTSITPPSPSDSSVAPVQWVTDPNTGATNLQVVPVNYVASPLSQVTNTPAVVPANNTYMPTNTGGLSFTNSRGSSILYPGDTWTISIKGAMLNQPVSVYGGITGSYNTSPMGSTDGSGNFSLSGTITANEIGSWYEQWSVGGVVSGSFSFQVQAVPVNTTNSTANQSVNSALSNNAGAQNTTNSTAGQNDGTTAGLDVGTWLEETFSVAGVSVPYWAVGAAGLGLVLIMMGMSGGRR